MNSESDSGKKSKTMLVVEDDLILILLHENYMENLEFEMEGEFVYGKTS